MSRLFFRCWLMLEYFSWKWKCSKENYHWWLPAFWIYAIKSMGVLNIIRINTSLSVSCCCLFEWKIKAKIIPLIVISWWKGHFDLWQFSDAICFVDRLKLRFSHFKRRFFCFVVFFFCFHMVSLANYKMCSLYACDALTLDDLHDELFSW